MRTHTNQDGITLLITLLLMGVLLGVSTSLLSVTLKQYQLSGFALASETAFQAANAGMECMLWHDLKTSPPSDDSDPDLNPFGVPSAGATISCMGASDTGNAALSGEEQNFSFDWGSDPAVCSNVSITKFDSASDVWVDIGGVRFRDTPCPGGSVCTVVQARGYNVPCADIADGSRVVEREYTQVY